MFTLFHKRPKATLRDTVAAQFRRTLAREMRMRSMRAFSNTDGDPMWVRCERLAMLDLANRLNEHVTEDDIARVEREALTSRGDYATAFAYGCADLVRGARDPRVAQAAERLTGTVHVPGIGAWQRS